MTTAVASALERTLPHSLDAERSVLGAVLLRNEGLYEAAEALAPVDFYRSAHNGIFAAMLDLHKRQEPIDLVTLRESLTAGGQLEAIGGAAYLTRLVDGVPLSTNVAHYAAIVKDKATKRRVIQQAHTILDYAYDGEVSADELLNEAERRIFDLSQTEQRSDLVDGAGQVEEVMPMLESLLKGERRGVTGLGTGFVDLDAFTQGLQPTDLIVIAARPSIGKSSLVSDIARHVAIELQQPVAFFSVEMSRRMTTMRNIIAQARVDGLRLRSGYVNQGDYERILQATNEIERSKLFVDDCSGLRPMELRSKARRLAAKHGLSLVIVDYMQLMRGDRGVRYENRQIEVASISRSLKGIAKELSVPLIAVCQLGRKVEERADKKPTLADLRESGAIEQDADVVGLIYRPGQGDPEADQGYAELIIAKQRNNPTGVMKMTWLSYASKFENYTEGGA
jgi:replicative DNA helicase